MGNSRSQLSQQRTILKGEYQHLGLLTKMLVLPAFLGSLVNVSIIHGGSSILSTKNFTEQLIPGHDVWDFPCYGFLIENENLGKKVLFDSGLMKAWREKLPPAGNCTLSYSFLLT